MSAEDNPPVQHAGRGRHLPGGAGWWRLGVASASLAALVWAAGAWDVGLRLDAGAAVTADDAGATSSGPASLVEASALACPGPELLGVQGEEGIEQRVVVAAAHGPADLQEVPAADGGSASLLVTGDGAAPIDTGTRNAVDLAIDEGVGALVLADGARAPGLVGGQLGVSVDPGSRGVSLVACASAAETQWLVGGGSAPGRTEQLVLTNPGDDAVTAQIDVMGAEGPAPTAGTSAVVVPARGRTVHLLDALAGPVEAPVVRVRTTGGPVVAHLGEHHRDGTTDLGSELVGPAAAPATDLVVPTVRPADLPENATTVTLRLAAPGDAAAVVDLTALTGEGAVRLASKVTRVAAGHTVDVVLDDLPDGALALRIRSDTPVTAGALLELAPSSDDPLPADGTTSTTPPPADGAGTTASPADGSAGTATPGDDAPGTAAPDDGSSATAMPDEEPPPLVRPSGETAWVAATVPSTGPVGLALPARDGIPGARTVLAVSVVDATEVTAHLLARDGTVARTELGRLPNDTTVTLDVPSDVRALWVTSEGAAGVVASVVVTGADRGGPYAAAATLPATPWARPLTEVTVVRP